MIRHLGQTLSAAGILTAVLFLFGCGDGTDGTNGKGSAAQRIVTGDWPMWGGTAARNMVNTSTGLNMNIQLPGKPDKKSKGLLWSKRLGTQNYGNPVVANGKVLVGTNNGVAHRPQHKGDRGCLLAFDAKTGDFVWQLTRKKLVAGRVNDWPRQGICSVPHVVGDRLWVVTNRCELMCLDLNGFYDGENDGPYKEEEDKEQQDADIVWSLDMIEELEVFPHNLATSSPVVYGDNVYLLTSNGVDEAHLNVPILEAPSFLAVNKDTGKVAWEDNSPMENILHGQWSSPAIGVVNGNAQVYFPGGDGWLYALDAKTGKHVWKCDLNPKGSKWELGRRGTRNSIIATPVFYENSVVIAVGQDPEHGEGVGHMYRIDATKTGDVTTSGLIWHLGGEDKDGKLLFRRTMSTVAIHDGLVYAADLSGFVYCVDFKTGKPYWEHDLGSAIWGSPSLMDGKVLIGSEDGHLTIFSTGKQKKVLHSVKFPSTIYMTPILAHGILYVTDRSNLYAFSTE